MSDPIPAVEAPPEPAPLSVAWCDAAIAAQQQLVNKRYADWQQSLGALDVFVALREIAAQQEESK